MPSLVEAFAVVVAAVCLSGCVAESDSEPLDIEDVTKLDERECPDESPLTYDNFGGPFVLSWCSGCHASALPEGERQAAPLGSDFDTLEQIRDAAPRIWDRAGDHNRTMPPQAGPEDEERARLGEWLACGAP